MTPSPPTAISIPPAERRVHPRYPVRLPVEMWQDSPDGPANAPRDGRPFCGALLDVSQSGIRFSSTHAFDVGAVIWLRVRFGRLTHYVKGTIKRQSVRRAAGRQEHEYGVRLSRCPQSTRFAAAVAVLAEEAADLDTCLPTRVA